MMGKIRVMVWNEGLAEKKSEKVRAVYPNGVCAPIVEYLSKEPDLEVMTACQDDPEHGLTEEVLSRTDVITWWSHGGRKLVDDAVVERVQKRVLEGMGIICLHSAHVAKIFMKLMGTTCMLKWREAGEKEVVWVANPGHEIAQGLDDHFIVEAEEMYGEPFDVPEPVETVFISSFAGGEVFRSGLTWRRGSGKVFYFQPGHETNPSYYNPSVLKVILNAVRWAAPTGPAKFIHGHRGEIGWWQKAPSAEQPK